MEIKQVIEELESSDIFKGWHKDAYLSYAMVVLGDEDSEEWRIGYYNPSKDRITTFIVSDSISMQEEEEVFKKEETKVRKVDTSKLSLTVEQILGHASEFVKKEYPKEMITKRIVILQNLDGFDTVWNITMISRQFNTLNIKLSPGTGEVLSHKIQSIFSFRES